MGGVADRLRVALRDYFPDISLGPTARFYRHLFGSVRPHKDVSRDGASRYTLPLYLSDSFNGGRLSIKTRRTEQELCESEPGMKHKVFTFSPRSGYAVIFQKGVLYWADEVTEGPKDLLIFDLATAF